MLRRIFAVVLILSLVGPMVMADETSDIDHLLGFIAASGCTFVRNGKTYDAEAARTHIEGKYDYAKRWIRTAEQFIEHAATESSLSGEPYRVICAGREEPSADWLKRELKRYRTSSSPDGNTESPSDN